MTARNPVSLNQELADVQKWARTGEQDVDEDHVDEPQD